MEIKAIDATTGEIKTFKNYSEASVFVSGDDNARTKIRKYAAINGTFMGYKWSAVGQPDNAPVDPTAVKIAQVNPKGSVESEDAYVTVTFSVREDENPTAISRTISEDIIQQAKRGYDYVDSVSVLNNISLIFRKKAE